MRGKITVGAPPKRKVTVVQPGPRKRPDAGGTAVANQPKPKPLAPAGAAAMIEDETSARPSGPART